MVRLQHLSLKKSFKKKSGDNMDINNFNLSFINDYALYIYLGLALVIIIMMIVFVLKLMKLNSAINEVNQGVNTIMGDIESSEIKADAIMNSTRKKTSLFLKTVALYQFMRYNLNKDNREFNRHMRDYNKHQENRKRVF